MCVYLSSVYISCVFLCLRIIYACVYQVSLWLSCRVCDMVAGGSFLCIERVVTAMSAQKLDSNYLNNGGRIFLLFDLLTLVILPITYVIIRVSQHIGSKDTIFQTVGPNGLLGVPWNSRQVPLEEKIQKFQTSLEGFEQQIRSEEDMKVFYFSTSVVVLVRLIAATKAHPRTAILVDTMIKSADDLWHFMLLLSILLAGFVMVAVIQFGGSRDEFSSGFRAVEEMWAMMTGGSLPISGVVESQWWSSDPALMIFALVFNFLVFMIMLNFIIAIIGM